MPIEGSELDLKQHFCKDGYLYAHMWFGLVEPVTRLSDAIDQIQDAIDQIQDADIFIVIGTSLQVYPVAGLIHEIPDICEAYYIDPKVIPTALTANFIK